MVQLCGAAAHKAAILRIHVGPWIHCGLCGGESAGEKGNLVSGMGLFAWVKRSWICRFCGQLVRCFEGTTHAALGERSMRCFVWW